MISKKVASSKQATLPRACDYTKTFEKDWVRLSRSGRCDLKRLKEAMLLLIANAAPLGPERLDPSLKGDWADHRERHIGGDVLLIFWTPSSQRISVPCFPASRMPAPLPAGRSASIILARARARSS
ncbi:MAG: type II toxin-antitoxin system YafQ family toxin [Rhodocyclaceae bacterium]